MENFSFIRRLSLLGTMMQTLFCGVKVGQDEFGNRYYRARGAAPKGRREQRWVIYAGEPEASKVPPEWHIWLHHMSSAPLAKNDVFHQPWQKPHQPNQSGTQAAWMPPGHTLGGGQRGKAIGDYEAWTP